MPTRGLTRKAVNAAFLTAEQIFLKAWEARAFLAFLLRLLIFLRIEYDYKNAEFYFLAGFACGEFLLKGPKAPDQKSVGRPKPFGAQRPTPFWWGAQTPVAEGEKN